MELRGNFVSENGGYFRYLYVGVLGSHPNPEKRGVI